MQALPSGSEVHVVDSQCYEVAIGESDGEPMVLVAGEVDLSAVDQLSAAIDKVRGGGRRLVIDLAETTFIDSAGLNVLAQAQREQSEAGLETLLRDPCASVTRALALCGLLDYFTIERTSTDPAEQHSNDR